MYNKRTRGRLLKANQTLTPRAHYEPVYDKNKVVAIARKFGLTTITGVSPIWTDQSGALGFDTSPLYLSYSSLESYDSNTKVVAVLSSIEFIALGSAATVYLSHSPNGGTSWGPVIGGGFPVGTVVPTRLVITPNVDSSITFCVDGSTDVSNTIVGLAGITGNIIKIAKQNISQNIDYTVNFRHYVINYE